jgi:peptide/nickel transport system substrate-binding protein
MQSSKKTFVTILVSLLVLTGCVKQGRDTTTTTTTTTTTGTPATTTDTTTTGQSSGVTSALPPVNPPYPGPFQTVVINGVEMRQARGEIGKYGGSLVRSAVGSDPKTFNPWTAADTFSRDLGGYMFSGLVGVDPYNGEIFPDMAKEIRVEPDGVTYTTVLRKGLKWSDGKPVTSKDVAFTWNELIAKGYGNTSLRDVTTIDGKSPTVTIVDELTNKFVTPKPFAPFARLLGIPIAPMHVVQPIIKGSDGHEAFQRLWSANSDMSKIVTLGPFKFGKYSPAQRVEFVRADNYYMVDKNNQRLPYLQKVVYINVPEVNTNLMKFQNKEIDITQVRSRDTVDLLGKQEAQNMKLYNLGQGIGSSFLMFNMNQRKNKNGKPYVDPVRSAWFNDVNFRQAVNHALNRDNMVSNYFRGIGFPLFTAEPPSSPYFNSTLKGFRQDLNYSLELLKKSGFKKEKDGFLYDKKGNRVEFDMLGASGGTFMEVIGTMIQEDLKKLGMKVNFQMINFNILADKVDQTKDWQALVYALSPGDPLEPNDGSNVYKSDGRLHIFDQRDAGPNGDIKVTDARPWEQELDRIFSEGAQTLDKAKRHQLYDRYQQIIYDQAPFIYLVSPMVIVGVRNTIGNYKPTQLSQSVVGLHNMEDLYKTDADGKVPAGAQLGQGTVVPPTTTPGTTTSSPTGTTTSSPQGTTTGTTPTSP